MTLEHPYEPRETTEYGANQIIKVLHKSDVALVNVGTGGGKTFMVIRAVAKRVPNANLIVLTTKKQVDSHHWEDSIDSYNDVMKTNLTYTVTNYEHLRVKKYFDEIVQNTLAIKNRFTIIILDECQRIKGYKPSQSFKAVLGLKQIPNAIKYIGLSATLASNSILDAGNYLILAGYYPNKTQFLNSHVTLWDDHYQPIVKDFNGDINPELIHDYDKLVSTINYITVTINTEDKVPPRKGWQKVFKYDKKTQKEYRDIIKAYKQGMFDSVQEAIMEERKFVALHADQRNAYVKQLITDNNRPNTPILIFYQYNIERQVIFNYLQEELNDYEIKIIAGDSKKVDVSKPDNPKTIFLIQYRAGGEGLNAPWSRFTIFYSPTNSYQDFKQAQGRNRRAGGHAMVYQVRLLVDKTVNYHMWTEVIDKKKRFTKQLESDLVDKE